MAQIYANEPLIASRERIGRFGSFGGLAIIFGGLIASFQNDILLAYGALILGFIVSNVGAYYLNRYAMPAFKKVGESLKGLDKNFRFYNYFLPAPHVLLTPFGVTVLLLKNQDGKIVGDEKGWRQSQGVIGILRSISAEGLGDPGKELEKQKETMRQFVSGVSSDSIPIDGYVVFTNPQAQVTIGNVDVPAIVLKTQPDALKNALRRDKRTRQLDEQVYNRIARLFNETAEEKQAEAEKGFRFWQR